MKNKRLIIASVLSAFLLSLSAFAWAQSPEKDAKFEKRIEHKIEKMQKKLNLSDAQVSRAKTIIEQSKPQLRADMEKMKDAPKDQKPALREQFKKDREATKEKLMAILTPEQRTKAERFMKKHDGKWHDGKNEKK